MNEPPALELTRDCPAVQIPAGNVVVLPAGTAVEVTQDLGGTFTVRALGGLFQIAGRDADALGRQSPAPADAAAPVAAETVGPLTEDQVWAALRTCYDPEIPVNIVDLGLIYDLRLSALPEGGSRVEVTMTLTAPGCGMGPVIAQDAREKILALPGVREAAVEVVWDPPWHPSMISAEGRRLLGLE
jgi:probable FeS assembly SUF system protein SufT